MTSVLKKPIYAKEIKLSNDKYTVTLLNDKNETIFSNIVNGSFSGYLKGNSSKSKKFNRDSKLIFTGDMNGESNVISNKDIEVFVTNNYVNQSDTSNISYQSDTSSISDYISDHIITDVSLILDYTYTYKINPLYQWKAPYNGFVISNIKNYKYDSTMYVSNQNNSISIKETGSSDYNRYLIFPVCMDTSIKTSSSESKYSFIPSSCEIKSMTIDDITTVPCNWDCANSTTNIEYETKTYDRLYFTDETNNTVFPVSVTAKAFNGDLNGVSETTTGLGINLKLNLIGDSTANSSMSIRSKSKCKINVVNNESRLANYSEKSKVSHKSMNTESVKYNDSVISSNDLFLLPDLSKAEPLDCIKLYKIWYTFESSGWIWYSMKNSLTIIRNGNVVSFDKENGCNHQVFIPITNKDIVTINSDIYIEDTLYFIPSKKGGTETYE